MSQVTGGKHWWRKRHTWFLPFIRGDFRHVITSPIPCRANLDAMPTVLEQWGQLWCKPSHVSTHTWHPITRSQQGATTGSVLTSLQITQLNACWSCVRKCVTLCTASTPFATSFSLLKGAAKVPHWCQCCCHCNLQWDCWWPFQEMTSLSISCSCCGLQPAPYGVLAASTLRVDFQNPVPWVLSLSSMGKHLLFKRTTSNYSWSFPISATAFKVHLLSWSLTLQLCSPRVGKTHLIQAQKCPFCSVRQQLWIYAKSPSTFCQLRSLGQTGLWCKWAYSKLQMESWFQVLVPLLSAALQVRDSPAPPLL